MDKEYLAKRLLSGLPIMVYDFDGREEEIDMVFYGGSVSWKSIYTLRKDAGGLICYVTGKEEGQKLGLNLITDELRNYQKYSRLVKRPVYGDEPAFAMWVNHMSTRTGISDEDRAKTILELHKTIEMLQIDEKEAKEKFFNEFMAPGHVPVLLSRGLNKRRGHTELTSSLMEFLGLKKSVVIAEMLDERYSMKRQKAEIYAKNNDIPLITGKDILEVLKVA
ncbi:3,4-dihydroxy-2-butanone-4-phosphate synthase [Sulfuracidifex metallicus]|jgi:3,4-dihydroxy 2-butanone 4-phosphate synthase|uniref:3,4-dihydroxy-2-butanone 4-phosphate synthase n=1 Tax=Sulfuracidifex metallicus DSM 6482 = JCM 9184 TaxID=523847 RepID=A0A6A9QGF3_SULME|nr:3,4-dihydroxy-2-butanone-4-phosphate synthase [Sulfuracidifex metallicus]MUN28287.1 3,4-dihydroxy-2-butanone 4-phosphate synthase [Sulfuracidifex metallicus DSM 6482 = JCM 9184]WOE51180.1 3,4-dihydroxy-2-butanone-4-phosphate synthase [Sulfuracidifex metallicus DSM 6482 = JCM 9184]